MGDIPPVLGAGAWTDVARARWDRLDPRWRVPVIAAVAVGAVALVLAGGRDSGPGASAAIEASLPTAAAAPAEPIEVVVHAAGAVRAPGIYHLARGARVADVITAAGGAAGDADLDRLNLAALVADGERVYVPRVGEAVPDGAVDAASASGPLDLNTASVDDLDELPGVGPATAQAIVDFRARHGRFTSVEQLLEVRGIGPAKLEALRDLVRV